MLVRAGRGPSLASRSNLTLSVSTRLLVKDLVDRFVDFPIACSSFSREFTLEAVKLVLERGIAIPIGTFGDGDWRVEVLEPHRYGERTKVDQDERHAT